MGAKHRVLLVQMQQSRKQLPAAVELLCKEGTHLASDGYKRLIQKRLEGLGAVAEERQPGK
jgi:hypothetical protein